MSRCSSWRRRTGSRPSTGTGRVTTSAWPPRRSSPCWPGWASTPRRRSGAWEALAAHHREPWTRMLPRCVAMREGHPYVVAVHVTDGDPVRRLGRAGDRRPARCCGSWRTGPRPGRSTAAGSGEASFEIPADLPLGYHTLRARSRRSGGGDAADHHPGLARVPGARGRAAGLGPGHPALQRPVARVLGGRRSGRPDRSGRLVGRRARRGLRPDQPAARRRAGAADGAVAVPADQPALRQPALPPAGADPRGGRSGRRASATPIAALRAGLDTQRVVADRRPQHGLDGQAGGAADHLRRAPVRRPPARLHGVPPAGRRAGCSGSRHGRC